MPNRVSVLVPMYGVERYIAKCARSLFSQYYKTCEFIFVDDASPDRTLEELSVVMSEFPHLEEQIKVVCHPQNMGVAAARNTALDAAEGNYIIFVDADDWVSPELVECLFIRAVETDADICNAWCDSVTEEDGAISCEPTRWIGSPRSHLKALLGQSHIVKNHVRGMLIRRSLFVDNALRFTPQVDFGEDFSLLPQLLYYSKNISTLCKYLYHYRVDNTKSYMSNISDKNIANYVEAFSIVETFIASKHDGDDYRKALNLGRINIKKWILWRGGNPSLYNDALMNGAKIHSPILKLYNTVVDGGNHTLVKLFSVCINLPLYLRNKVRS